MRIYMCVCVYLYLYIYNCTYIYIICISIILVLLTVQTIACTKTPSSLGPPQSRRQGQGLAGTVGSKRHSFITVMHVYY